MELRAWVAGPGLARRLVRRLKALGAPRVLSEGEMLWALLPLGPAAAQAVALAGRMGALRLVVQWNDRPLHQPWVRPLGYPIAMGLRLAEGWWGRSGGEGEIVVEPMDAFGSGMHPSSWLNAGALGQVLAAGMVQDHGWAVDLGSGSGVLSLVIAALSPLSVLAVDPAAQARRALARNASLNPRISARIHFVQATHQVLAGPFVLGAANLPLAVMREALPALAAALAPGAIAVLSGLRAGAMGWLEEKMRLNGLEVLGWGREAGWIVAVGRKNGRDGAI